MSKELTFIDLFAGCGGLSLGLINAGWKGIFAVEKNPDAFNTLQKNLISDTFLFRLICYILSQEMEIIMSISRIILYSKRNYNFLRIPFKSCSAHKDVAVFFSSC